MNLYDTIFEVIDMRSFSNLWYWIALAVVWSTASHFVLGVPFDLILRAKRQGGEAAADMLDLVRINVHRIMYITGVSGLWIAGIGSAVLSGLGILGFFYRVEFAQAVFLLAFPMTLVGLLSLRTATRIYTVDLDEEGLYNTLRRHRFFTQLIGMLSILITAMWGMYQNLNIGPFGS